MMTHVLAEQVMKRLGSGTKSRRSQMLSRIAAQLQAIHEVELVWQARRAACEDTVAKIQEACRERDARTMAIQQDINSTIEKNQRRLAAACRELCNTLDEHRSENFMNEEKIRDSRFRLDTQQRMVDELAQENASSQDALEKVLGKYNELSRTAAHEAAKLPPEALEYADVDAALNRGGQLAKELEASRTELAALRAKKTRVQGELAESRGLALRFEDFTRSMAAGPSTSIRTGGGFVLDSAAKREASALMKAAADGMPLPPSPRPPPARPPGTSPLAVVVA